MKIYFKSQTKELRSTSGGKISSINQVTYPIRSDPNVNLWSQNWTSFNDVFKMYTEIDPLMDETEAVEGDLWLSGNRTLIALNLSSKNKQ